jgi:hypothetical protein
VAGKAFLTLADYLDDVVRYGRNRAPGVMRNMPDINWSEMSPPVMTRADTSAYGPNVDRVWSLLDFIENAPDDALRIASRSNPRIMRNISTYDDIVSGNVGTTNMGAGGLYAPGISSGIRQNVSGLPEEAKSVKQVYAKLAELTGAKTGGRVEQAKNAERVAANLMRDRLSSMGYGNMSDSARAARAALAESALDVTERFPQAYSSLTMPLETGLRAAQVGSRYGGDYLQGLEALSVAQPNLLNPARVIKLGEAPGLNPDVVNRAINNIIARNEPIRGGTVQDEIFRLLGREDMVSKTNYRTLAESEKSGKGLTRRLEMERAAASSAGTTPAERQLNRMLDQVLTNEEKAGLSYMTPAQLGEFIQQVIAERLPALGGA